MSLVGNNLDYRLLSNFTVELNLLKNVEFTLLFFFLLFFLLEKYGCEGQAGSLVDPIVA